MSKEMKVVGHVVETSRHWIHEDREHRRCRIIGGEAMEITRCPNDIGLEFGDTVEIVIRKKKGK